MVLNLLGSYFQAPKSRLWFGGDPEGPWFNQSHTEDSDVNRGVKDSSGVLCHNLGF